MIKVTVTDKAGDKTVIICKEFSIKGPLLILENNGIAAIINTFNVYKVDVREDKEEQYEYVDESDRETERVR